MALSPRYFRIARPTSQSDQRLGSGPLKGSFWRHQKKRAPSSVSSNDDLLNHDLSCDTVVAIPVEGCDGMSAVRKDIDMEPAKTQPVPQENQEEDATATKAACSPFGSLCGDVPQSFLPSHSWGRHILKLDGLKSVVFSQMKRAKKPDYASSENSSVPRATAAFVSPRIFEIDEKMKANVMLMGQSVPLSRLQYTGSLATTEEV